MQDQAFIPMCPMTSADHLPLTLPDYHARAAEALQAEQSAYFLSGAGEGVTMRSNRRDFEAIGLRPQVLQELRNGDTKLTLFGTQLAHPILVAPFAYQSLLDEGGETATAQGATAQEALMVLSAQSSQRMEDVRAQGGTCNWFQLYWQTNLGGTSMLAERAAKAGFQVLVLTVDAPVNGVRDDEMRTGFNLPDTVRPVNLDGLPQPVFDPLSESESFLFNRIVHVLPRWDDLRSFCEQSPLPVVVKGLLTPEDATRAVKAGAAGVIVSNHGGRVLDGAPSAISVLPNIVRALGGSVPVLMDSGVRRGSDVFKALALGADAVLVGRPVVCGLAVAGALGVSHVLRLLRDELEVTMALTGCRTLADITPDRVIPDAHRVT